MSEQQPQPQESETMRKLREKVKEANAQSETNRQFKGGNGPVGAC